MTNDCVILDLDGTIADTRHRQHLVQGPSPHWVQYSMACGQDRVVPGVLALVQSLALSGNTIVIVSGRHNEAREATLFWLLRARVPHGPVFLRNPGDLRPNVPVKLDFIHRVRAMGFYPRLAIDDYAKVAEAYEAIGIPTVLVSRDGVSKSSRLETGK